MSLGIIIGHTDEPHYVQIGKLADGTPVYKHMPPPGPDPKVIYEKRKKAIDDYNTTTEISPEDTAEFTQPLQREQEKLEEENQYLERLRAEQEDNVVQENLNQTPPTGGVMDYFITSENKERDEVETYNYLDLFIKEENKQRANQLKADSIHAQHETVLAEEDKRREASAKKYELFLQSLKEEELEELREFEQLVEERELQLREIYDQVLVSEDEVPLFTVPDDLDVQIDSDSNNVIVTNIKNGVEKSFNYIGDLKSVEVKGYRLTMYSVVRGDKEYGIIKESHSFITHRHIVYDLRTLGIISRESFAVSKLDPTSISKDDPDVYYEGWSWQTRSLSAIGQPWVIHQNPGKYVLNLDNVTVPLDRGDRKDVPTRMSITKFLIEAWGAGGAGASGCDNGSGGTMGAGGGGGSYVRKTVQLHAHQVRALTGREMGLILRMNVGDGAYRGAVNRALHSTNQGHSVWDPTRPTFNQFRDEKDTWVCVDSYDHGHGTHREQETAMHDPGRPTTIGGHMSATYSNYETLSVCAGGGYDGDNGPALSALFAGTDREPGQDAGYPGRPLGDFWVHADHPDDRRYWGSGNLPWEVMRYQLSGVCTAEQWEGDPWTDGSYEDPDSGTVIYGTKFYGWSHNGALSTGPGVGSADLQARSGSGKLSGWWPLSGYYREFATSSEPGVGSYYGYFTGNSGLSSGTAATSFSLADSGHPVAAGGGAGYSIEPYSTMWPGSAGGNGMLRITLLEGTHLMYASTTQLPTPQPGHAGD